MLSEQDIATFYDQIGGSSVPAILGVDENKSPYDLWLEFTDPSTRPDMSDNEPVLWGNLLEPVIVQEVARRLGAACQYSPEPIIHPKYPFMRARPDALVLAPAEDIYNVDNCSGLDDVKEKTRTILGRPSVAGIEVKNRGFFMGKHYGDEDSEDVLDSEAIQCHMGMACSGLPRWHLGVLIGGQKLRMFAIQRDEEMCRIIEEACVEFWGYVQRKEPPPPSNISDCHRRWPKEAPGLRIAADARLADLIAQRQTLKGVLGDTDARLSAVEFRIKMAMKDAEAVTVDGKPVLTWKADKNGKRTMRG